jgi:hypothetical protein
VDDFVAGELTIKPRTDKPNVIRLDWHGKSNARQPAVVLAPFFKEVTKQASQQGAVLEMHFEELEHFNSSTITAIIQLIQELPSMNVKLVLVFNAGLKWQKLSFDALRIFEKADGLLTFRPIN